MSTYIINQKFFAVPPETGAPPSERVLAVAEMFGIGLDASYEVTLYDRLRLDVRPGDVVFATGPSGSGKSVLLRALAEAIRHAHPEGTFVDLAEQSAPADRAVIDGLDAPFDAALRRLSTAGLADAFLLLRPPGELSDGQRWRLRLAHALVRLGEPVGDGTWRVLIADEFASTLDRSCTRALAYRLRKLADRERITILAASAHNDLLEDLAPDVLILKDPGDSAEVYYADPSRDPETRP